MTEPGEKRFQAVKEQYPVGLPDEIARLWELAAEINEGQPSMFLGQEAIAVRFVGPFALLGGGAGPQVPRRGSKDPAEFFVVAESTADAYRWGYWFDEPQGAPIVVGFDADDSPIKIDFCGINLTAALVRHLEATAERLEEDLQYDPAGAEYYREGLTQVSASRQFLVQFASKYGLGLTGKPEREVVAPTVDGMGIVALRESFVELLPVEELQRSLARGDSGQLLSRAEGALKDGFPTTSLQVAKALSGVTGQPDLRRQASELMAKSYEALARGPLAQVVRSHAADASDNA